MRSFFLLAMALSVAAASAPVCAADAVGLRLLTVMAPERGQSLDVRLWYPAAAGGTPVRLGDSKVFQGVPAQQDAPIAEGAFPIILVSHGGLRSAPNLTGWIASRLADLGFVVAVTRPPDLGDRGAEAAIPEIWLRPADLSATLTALLDDPNLVGHLELEQVGALGFLLGGTSALALVGARLDADSYSRSCDEGGTGLDCAWFARSGIDLHAIDTAQLTRSNLDDRIEVAVAVDPELSDSFTAESLSSIAVPVEIINLGSPETIRPGLDAANLAGPIATARYAIVPDASEFSAFSLCTPQAPEILLEDGEDDTICRDGGGRPREEIHDELAQMIAEAFRRYLQTAP